MGLRYRKSISLLPGVRLNIGKSSMSISTGVPGFRKTYSTTGKVTTTIGIPGTGLYYVDTKNSNIGRGTTGNTAHPREYHPEVHRSEYVQRDAYSEPHTDVILHETEPVKEKAPQAQINVNAIRSIHKAADDTIDWTEVLVSPEPPDESYNEQMWRYYHEMAPQILSGNIDSYLQLIYEVNPLDDLMAYGSGFEFGTDAAQKIEVEFTVNGDALISAKRTMSKSAYNDLLQDYVCSVCIRIARDMFALLPVSDVVVHAVLSEETIVSVKFDRGTLSKVKFGLIDPSDTVERFPHEMDYSEQGGLQSVNRIL